MAGTTWRRMFRVYERYVLSSSVGGACVGSHSSSRNSRTVTRSGRTHVPFCSELNALMRAASASLRVR